MTRFQHAWKAALGLSIGIGLACASSVFARELGSREAREALANLLGRAPDGLRIKDVSPGLTSGDATVTAQMDVTFQMHKGTDGSWKVAALRLSSGHWEDIEALRRALDSEKAERARRDLGDLAVGVEAFRRERGFIPHVDSVGALVDQISPKYQPRVIRTDPWNQPYLYAAGEAGYSLSSVGPDGVRGSADDLVVAKGGSVQ